MKLNGYPQLNVTGWAFPALLPDQLAAVVEFDSSDVVAWGHTRVSGRSNNAVVAKLADGRLVFPMGKLQDTESLKWLRKVTRSVRCFSGKLAFGDQGVSWTEVTA